MEWQFFTVDLESWFRISSDSALVVADLLWISSGTDERQYCRNSELIYFI